MFWLFFLFFISHSQWWEMQNQTMQHEQLESTSYGFSRPLNEISWNFQALIFFVIQLNPPTQKDSGRTVEKVWSNRVLWFLPGYVWPRTQSCCLSQPLGQISSNFQHFILFVSLLNKPTQKNSGRIVEKVRSLASFVFFSSDFWARTKSLGFSELLRQIGSNFQKSILFISQLNHPPQNKSARTLEKVWS